MIATPRRAVALFALVAAVDLLSGAAVHAEEKDKDKAKDNKAAAKEHYQRGTSFYDLGRYPDAIKEFEAAYELKNDPAFLYNLAQSYRQAGDAEQALHFYRTYLRYVPKPANRAEIDERIAALEQQIAQKGGTPVQPPGGQGTMTPSTAPPPVGQGTTPPPPLTPPPGGQGTMTPPPPPTGPAMPPPAAMPPVYGASPPGATVTPPAPPAADRARGQKYQMAGMITAGAGGLMFLVGIVEGLRAKSASQDIETAATKGLAFDPAVQSRGQSAEKAEAVFLTLGVLAGAGGAALWYYGRRVSAAAESATTSYRISFAPVVSPAGGGGWLRVSF